MIVFTAAAVPGFVIALIGIILTLVIPFTATYEREIAYYSYLNSRNFILHYIGLVLIKSALLIRTMARAVLYLLILAGAKLLLCVLFGNL